MFKSVDRLETHYRLRFNPFYRKHNHPGSNEGECSAEPFLAPRGNLIPTDRLKPVTPVRNPTKVGKPYHLTYS
ncbi:hypothetical protein Hanom_Chr05g00474911 [Helianthus anomalus]